MALVSCSPSGLSGSDGAFSLGQLAVQGSGVRGVADKVNQLPYVADGYLAGGGSKSSSRRALRACRFPEALA